MKIVVIDDDPCVLLLLKRALRLSGYEVEAYPSASESPLAKTMKTCPCDVHPQCPDVIMVDLEMPGINGVDFLLKLNERGCRCKRMAIMTGYSVPEYDMMRIAKFGARVFLKPFELHEFTTWIQREAV